MNSRPVRLSFVLLLCATHGAAQTPVLVSATPDGAGANASSAIVLLSGDGRFVAFSSNATDLVPGDTNGAQDVFVRDMLAGTTERVSVSSSEQEANDASGLNAISADGRYVLMGTAATNLAPAGAHCILLRDRLTGQTSVASLKPSGNPAAAREGRISDDGRFVAFQVDGSGFVPADTSTWTDVFVRDRDTGQIELVSVSTQGVPGNGHSGMESCYHSMSGDGRWVVFESSAGNLLDGMPLPPGKEHVYAHDRATGATMLLDVTPAGSVGNGDSILPAISADGRFAGFFTSSTNLVPDTNAGMQDLLVRELATGALELVSVGSSGAQSNWYLHDFNLSGDGRFAAFCTQSTNLDASDTGQDYDIYLRDRLTGLTHLASRPATGLPKLPGFSAVDGDVSRDGAYVGFEAAGTLVAADTNTVADCYRFSRSDAPPWSDLGQGLAGQAGVPVLDADGPLTAGSPVFVALAQAKPVSSATLVIGFATAMLPLKGGILVPAPIVLLNVATGAAGKLKLSGHVPSGLPAGTQLVFQYWIKDAAGPQGLSASNALRGITP